MASARRESVLFGVVALLILVLSMIVGAGGSQESPYDPRPSTYHSSGMGGRALSLVLRELGIEVEVRRRSLDLGEIEGPLVILAPTVEMTPGEIRRLHAWVREGGTLIYAARRNDPLLDTLGLEVASLTWNDERRLRFSEEKRTARPAPHPWTAGAGPLSAVRDGWDPESPALADARPLATFGDTAVIAVVPVGAGRVVAWADALPLVNRELRESGAAVYFARVVAAVAPGGTVVFDEFHHGYGAEGNVYAWTARFVRDHPVGRALLQGSLVALLALLAAGRRFGAALPPPPARRRSPLEHVEALAGAYRRAEARRTVRRLLLLGLARRLGRRPPVDAAAEAALVESLPALPAAGDAARALQDEWKKGDGADLVALARDVDRLLDEVRKT